MMDIKIFTNGGGQGALSVHKNEKITRTVPILKSNSTYFSFIFSMMDINIFTNWRCRVGRRVGDFFLTYYYII